MLHVAYGTVVWGAEQTILRLAPLLDERGIDVALAAPAGGALEPAWRALGFPFVPIDVLERPGLRRSDGSGRRPSATTLAREGTTIARSAARMAAVVGRTKSDLVHSHALQGHLELAIAARLRGRSAVLHQHDLVLPGMGRQVLGVATSVAGEMIAISEAVAECVPGRGALPVWTSCTTASISSASGPGRSTPAYVTRSAVPTRSSSASSAASIRRKGSTASFGR